MVPEAVVIETAVVGDDRRLGDRCRAALPPRAAGTPHEGDRHHYAARPMRLSRRVQSLTESSTLAASARAKALQAKGVDVVGFGAGEPDFSTPAPICRAAIEALESGMTHYVATAGAPAARRTIAEKLERENGVPCAAEDVVITVGAKHAIYLVLQCLLDPPREGEAASEVILPTPAWVSYRPLVELAGGAVVEVPSSLDSGFRVDPQRIAAALTPRTAAIVLNSPSNPCGTVMSPDDIRALEVVLKDRADVVVISDEIYEKLIYPEVEPGVQCLSPGSLAGLRERTITINGMSKAYAMTGWRIGYAACPRGSGLAPEMIKLQGQMTNNITSFVYPAIIEALTRGGAEVERMRLAFAERAQLFHGLLSAIPGIETVRPGGAFYLFPRISRLFGRRSPAGVLIDSASAFADALLEEAAVAVVPGEDFGGPGREHIRLSFACSPEEIRKGCERISRFVESLR